MANHQLSHLPTPTRINMYDLQNAWEKYWSCRRIYDDFSNQWDLCDLILVDDSKITDEERQYRVNNACYDGDEILDETAIPTESDNVDLKDEEAAQQRNILLGNPKKYPMHHFGFLFNTPVSNPPDKAHRISALGVDIQEDAGNNYEGNAEMRVVVEMITKKRPNPARQGSHMRTYRLG